MSGSPWRSHRSTEVAEALAERLRMCLAEAGYPRAHVFVMEEWDNDVHTVTWTRDPHVEAVPPEVVAQAWKVLEASS